ncbi:MAG: HDOD domain-containing protein [Georgfuchsia sp.]
MDKRDILKTLVIEAGQGDLDFRTHAAVTLRVRLSLEDPDVPVAAVAKLIQAEPVLAARVVAVANSTAFNNSGRAIADVQSAVTRLGFRNVRSLATALLVRQMGTAATGNPVQQRMAAQLWEHTSQVTALAHVLARRVTHVDAEAALFIGIIHDVGGFYLLSRAPDFPGLLEGDAADWDEADMLELEVELGRTVLRALAIPEAAMTALEVYWQGFLSMPPHTLGDTLLLAEDMSSIASPFHEPAIRCGKDGNETQNGAAASIEVILGADTLSGILKESAAEVSSLADALQL